MEVTDTTTVMLDDETRERLQRLANAKHMPVEEVASLAVTEYVALEGEREERRKRFDKDTLLALDEYERTGLHLTADEMDAWFARIEAGEDVEPPECHA